MLQDKTEVSRGLVFASKVLAVVDINIVELDKADEVTGRLGLPFGHIINSRGPQLEQPLFPRLLAIFFEVEHPLEIRHDDGSPTEVLLY